MNLKKTFLSVFVAFQFLSCSSGPSLASRPSQEQTIQPRPEPPAKTQIPKATPEKIFDAARKLFDAKEFNKSYDYYMFAAQAWTGKPREAEALVWADRSLVRGSRFHEAIELSIQLLKTRKWNEALTSEITGYLFKSQEAIGDLLSTLSTAAEAQTNPMLAKEAEAYRLKSNEIIENKLSPNDLEKVADQDSMGLARAKANQRLGEMSLEVRDQDGARKYFARAISIAPTSDAGIRSQEMLDQLEAVRRVESKTIGVVLPM
ncbi:MAG: hypothetical protein ACXWC9_10700, partial [Pseudobdellovibrionaceae bacterium]